MRSLTMRVVLAVALLGLVLTGSGCGALHRHEKGELKSFQTPDEVREFPNGKVKMVNFSRGAIGEITLQPGWRWSKDVKPTAKTESCQAPHFQYQLSGTLVIQMDDGTKIVSKKGDVTSLPVGHDAWVEGNEAVVLVDWTGASTFAK